MKKRNLLYCAVLAAAATGFVACGESNSGGEDQPQDVTCGGQVCAAGQICDSATNTCVPGSVACNAGEAPSCDGNSIKKCVNGKYELTSCGEQLCDAGVCKDAGDVQCSDDDPAECAGNMVKSCKDGVYVTEDCGDRFCENGACQEKQAECDSSEAAVCDGNSVKSCVGGEYQMEDCGDKTCEDGACKDATVIEPDDKECENEDAPVCDGNSVKKCENNKYVLVNCEDDSMVCKEGACIQEELQHDCENDMTAYCEGDVVVKCVDNSFDKNTVCGDTQICRDGGCVDLGEGEVKCGADYKPVCNDDGTITSCVDNIVHSASCGAQVCEVGEDGAASCVDPKCNESDPAVCDGSGLKKCVDGVWTTEPCGDKMTCDAEKNECVSLAMADVCPGDDNKTAPGVCGCGIPDQDLNANGTEDCKEIADLCPDDPNKTLPGICGCGIADDLDENGNPKCLVNDKIKDLCPNDPNKVTPGVCGCGYPDTINPLTRLPQCISVGAAGTTTDLCPADKNKTLPGVCGCGVADDLDDNGFPKCLSEEPVLCGEEEGVAEGKKGKAPGFCGCEMEDADSDGDGVIDCLDECPNNKYLFAYDNMCNPKKQCDKVRVSIDGKDYCANMITNAQEFVDFRNNINGSKITNSANTVFALMEDIDLYDVFPSGESDWTGINGYKGKFVSDGKTIKFTDGEGGAGVLRCAHDRCGLFRSLTNARIDNLKLDFDVEDSGSYSYVGTLVGEATGSEISNIASKGKVTSGGYYEGGIVGRAASSKISNVKFEGDVVNKSTSGHRYIGGVAGILTVSSSLENAEVVGNVTADSAHDVGGVVGLIEKYNSTAGSENGIIKNASFKGNVKSSYTARDSVGGIVGRAIDSNLSDLKFDGSVEGNSSVGGIVGQALVNATYADPKKPASLTNATVSEESIVKGRSYVGGIVGNSQIELRDLTSAGKIDAKRVVGGIVGQQKGAMNNLTNNAEFAIENDLSGTAYAGGVVGELFGGFNHAKLTNTKDITVDCSAKGAGYCNSVGGVIGHITNETVGTSLTELKNSGKIDAKGSYIGGVVGHGTSIEFNNVENTGDIVAGGTLVGGVIGELYYRDSAKSRKVNFKMDNAKNSGNITGATGSVGGAIGNLHTFNAGEALVLNNIVNKGNIDVTGGNVGGFLGNIQQNGVVTITDVYNSGSVKSTGNYIGGFIGSISAMNDSNKRGSGARTISITIDRASASGDVEGNQYVGGFIGYLSTHFENRYIEKELEETCAADPSKTSKYNQWKWFNATNNIVIRNAFAQGNVDGVSNLGGFIGYAEGSSQNSLTYTNTKYAYVDFDANNHCKWTALSTATDPGVVYTYNRRGSLTIANAYAAGSVTRKSGSATTVGGFFGNINYSTGSSSWNWLLNNVYQTGSVTEAGGSFFGMKPTTTNIRNAYYWYASGTTFNVPANSNSNANLATITPFNYENAMPHIMKNGEISKVKLKDQLNTNINASTNAELSSSLSKKWDNIDFMLGSEQVSIPTIVDVKPAD